MFDINEVKISGKVISLNSGDAKDKIPYVNIYIESKGKKYSDTLHCSFYGENAVQVLADVKEGDKIMVSGKVIGKKVVDTVALKLVGNYFFRIYD